MNIKLKKTMFAHLLFFVSLIILSTNSFCSSYNIANGKLAMPAAVLEITNTKTLDAAFKVPSLIFNKPGDQTLTIENHLATDIKVGNLFFIGDLFTTPLVVRGLSLRGQAGCHLIKAGTSCSFIINAADNASPTFNSDGITLLLNYKTVDDHENKIAAFKVKIDYNQDIIFGVRNLEFTLQTQHRFHQNYPASSFINQYPQQGTSSEHFDFIVPAEQKLTIINNNAHNNIIKITNVQLLSHEANSTIGDYKNCSSLRHGEFCEVTLTLHDFYAKNAIVPIYVTYDLIDDHNHIIKKDLTAVAAAKINFENARMRPQKAFINGVITTASVKLAYSSTVKTLFIAVIGNSVNRRDTTATTNSLNNLIIDGAIGMNAGIVYSVADVLANTLCAHEYNPSQFVNKLTETIVFHALSGLTACSNIATGGSAFAPCIIATVGCGLVATFGTKAVGDTIYSNVILQLPEYSQHTTYATKSKLIFGFATSGVIRVACKNIFNVPHGGLTEIYQDILSSIAMTGMNELPSVFSSKIPLSAGEDAAKITDYNCADNECTCSYLPLRN